VLLACLLHVLLPRQRRFLGAGLHLNQLSRFPGPPQTAGSTGPSPSKTALCLELDDRTVGAHDLAKRLAAAGEAYCPGIVEVLQLIVIGTLAIAWALLRL
jgi:hypothetical protein